MNICDELFDRYINQDCLYRFGYPRDRLRVGDIVRHFKADLSEKDHVYEVIAISLNCSDDSWCVTYKELFGDHRAFVRDYDEFMSLVNSEKYPEAKQFYRFEVIGHNSKGGLHEDY